MSRAVDPQPGLSRSGLRRWPAIGAATLLASCAPAGILDPRGPIAAAERLLLTVPRPGR